jgi:hypothetical protein
MDLCLTTSDWKPGDDVSVHTAGECIDWLDLVPGVETLVLRHERELLEVVYWLVACAGVGEAPRFRDLLIICNDELIAVKALTLLRAAGLRGRYLRPNASPDDPQVQLVNRLRLQRRGRIRRAKPGPWTGRD